MPEHNTAPDYFELINKYHKLGLHPARGTFVSLYDGACPVSVLLGGRKVLDMRDLDTALTALNWTYEFYIGFIHGWDYGHIPDRIRVPSTGRLLLPFESPDYMSGFEEATELHDTFVERGRLPKRDGNYVATAAPEGELAQAFAEAPF